MHTELRQRRPRFLSAAFLAALVLVTGAGRDAERLPVPIIFTQEPLSSNAPHTTGCPPGSRIVRLEPDGTLLVLTGEMAAACEPAVSFDGTRVLFAGKQLHEDPWDIWEMQADGSAKRRLTAQLREQRELGDCREPVYLASASVTPPSFDDRVPWISFTSTAAGALDEQGAAPAPSLYAMSLEPVAGRGTVLWRTTYNLGGDCSPTTMQDGRVLFTSRQRGGSALMTITWAGDNLNPFTGIDGGAPGKTMACELADRTVVFIESDTPDPGSGGELVRVSLRRPLHSREVLGKDGFFHTPHSLSAGELLVSHTAGGDSSYGLFRFDLASGRLTTPIYDDPELHDVDAIPLRSHPEPIARIPMLEFASVLDIEGFSGAGQLHCMSVYDSDQPEIQRLAPGQVRWARFLEGIPQPAHEGWTEEPLGGSDAWPPPGVTTRIRGEAPVEPDGSFFVNIVGNTPFSIELLDADKVPLHTMRSWMWVRSGSQRGCIGCHEDKELAPRNRATEALLRMRPTMIGAPAEQQLLSTHSRDQSAAGATK